MTPIILVALLAAAGNPELSAPLPSAPCCGVGAQDEIAPAWCYVRPGDLLLFQTSNNYSCLLCQAAFCGSTTHAAIAVARPDHGVVLLEMPTVGGEVTLSDPCCRLPEYKGKIWVRRRTVPLTPEQSSQLTSFAWSQAGKKYDFVGVVLAPFRCPTRFFGKKCPDPNRKEQERWFCSSLVVAACAAAGLVDPCKVRPNAAVPVDLRLDLLLDLSKDWEPPVLMPTKYKVGE